MLQQSDPEDFVIGTGESHSVKEFVELAFQCAGLPDWESYVDIDSRYYRPTEVENLIADSRKAREKLDWRPKTDFQTLVKIMVQFDLESYGLKEDAAKIRIR
jgi:GDPmannose 4,6-dehydratase